MRETMNISLEPAEKKWVAKQLRARGFSTASEYVRHCFRLDRAQREAVELALLKGLQSGKPAPMTAREWSSMRKEAQARLRGRGRK